MDHTDNTDALLAEIDAAMAAYSASIERGLELARGLQAACDGIEGGLADAWAELAEWL